MGYTSERVREAVGASGPAQESRFTLADGTKRGALRTGEPEASDLGAGSTRRHRARPYPLDRRRRISNADAVPAKVESVEQVSLCLLLVSLIASGFAHYYWILLSDRQQWLLATVAAVLLASGLFAWWSRAFGGGTTRGAALTLFSGAAAGALLVGSSFRVANAALDRGPAVVHTASIVRLQAERNLRFAELRFAELSGVALVPVARALAAKLRVGDQLQVPVWPGALGEPYVKRQYVIEAAEGLVPRR